MLSCISPYFNRTYAINSVYQPYFLIMGRKTEKSQPPKKEVLKGTIDKILRRRTFEPYNRPTVGCRFLRLTKPGDTVIGWLGFPIRNFQQSTSYPIQLENGEIIEICGNRLLHKQIREGELCGQKIELVYQGRDYTHYGHYRKIYRIYKVGEETMSKAAWNKIIKDWEERKRKNG